MQDAAPNDAAPSDAMDDAGQDASQPPVDTLTSNRDRLLGSYLDFLKTSASAPQSNGLSGSNVSTVCDIWQQLDPSSKATFLTITARLQGSLLGSDDHSALFHVTKLYRVTGGQGATMNDPGSCGGGEYNRMMMAMDGTLHGALLAANQHQGAVQGNGKRDLADVPQGGFWRDSHDLAGAHSPFDTSDETEQGAPRGQTHYFADVASSAANAPLGRMDLTSLVDPLALEMDHDYDCIHSSNPLCTYIAYGPLCLPQPQALGTDIYVQTYGDFNAAYVPTGCP